MPKRKISFSSQDSNESWGTKRSTLRTSAQPTRGSSICSRASGRVRPATLLSFEQISDNFPTTPSLPGRHINDTDQGQYFRHQNVQEIGISCALTENASSQSPTSNSSSTVSCPYPVPNAAYLAGTFAQPILSSSTVVHGLEPVRKVPQMTYQRYQALLRSLGYVRGVASPRRLTGRPPNLLRNHLGPRSDRKTDFRIEQAEWSIDNMPEIIYTFKQPKDYYDNMLKETPLKSYTAHSGKLRDFPILPDRISPDSEGWLYEYWYRLDPRIGYERDIAPRIRPDQRPRYPTRFSQSRLRFQKDCHLLGWFMKSKSFDDDLEDVLNAATEAAVDVEATNSTRGLTWGLIDPTKGEDGGRVPVPNGLRPKNTRDNEPAVENVLPASGSSSLSF